MMSRIVSLLLVFLTTTLADQRHPWDPQPKIPDLSLTNVDKTCINRYNETQNDDFLIGTWYKIYKFYLWLNLVPSLSCSEVIISRPTEDEVQAYKKKYNRTEAPYKFDNAFKMDVPFKYRPKNEYMTFGSGAVNFILPSPNSTMSLNNREYNLKVFKKINEDYLLDVECMWRSKVFWLWTKHRNATDNELMTVIKGIRELDKMETQRFCSPK